MGEKNLAFEVDYNFHKFLGNFFDCATFKILIPNGDDKGEFEEFFVGEDVSGIPRRELVRGIIKDFHSSHERVIFTKIYPREIGGTVYYVLHGAGDSYSGEWHFSQLGSCMDNAEHFEGYARAYRIQ